MLCWHYLGDWFVLVLGAVVVVLVVSGEQGLWIAVFHPSKQFISFNPRVLVDQPLEDFFRAMIWTSLTKDISKLCSAQSSRIQSKPKKRHAVVVVVAVTASDQQNTKQCPGRNHFHPPTDNSRVGKMCANTFKLLTHFTNQDATSVNEWGQCPNQCWSSALPL